MKTTMVLLAGMFMMSVSSCSQNIPANKVPSVVQNTLKAKFANAISVEWEWEKKEQLFEAEFNFDSTEFTAHIDPAGKLVMYKIDIKISELPEPIVSTIRQEYSNYEIDEAGKIEKDGRTYYIVELERKGEKDKKLLFSGDGTLEDKMTSIR